MKIKLDYYLIRDWVISILGEIKNEVLPELLNNRIDINEKNTQDFVTNIDVAIEDYLISKIRSEYPEHNILGEESDFLFNEFSNTAWVIDPLDGTLNFINNIPFYAISIALLHKGKVVVAVVYDIAHDEMFDAIAESGARLNGAPLLTSDEKRSSNFIAISTGVIDKIFIESPSLITKFREFGKIRVMGCQALQLCYVACGRLVANISVEAKIWDDLAGALIVEESGCCYKSLSGFDLNHLDSSFKDRNLYSIASIPSSMSILQEYYSKLI